MRQTHETVLLTIEEVNRVLYSSVPAMACYSANLLDRTKKAAIAETVEQKPWKCSITGKEEVNKEDCSLLQAPILPDP